MNKSLATNLVAAAVLAAGLLLPHPTLKAIGLFALSGAVTNWLAIHMLFERVPGLYGSGIVPLHFDEFRVAIRKLMVEQFFTTENIDRVIRRQADEVDISGVIERMDLSPMFDELIKTIEESSFGGMLSMIGGGEGLNGLREPFIRRMKGSLARIADSDQVQRALRSGLSGGDGNGTLVTRIETIIDQRLAELTPQLVKTIIQEMIRRHLGWLVVWGGVFGGLIGLLTTLI